MTYLAGKADKTETPAQKRRRLKAKAEAKKKTPKGGDQKKVPVKRPGRPTMFSAEVADEICERIADAESIRSICLDSKMPAKRTVFYWLAQAEMDNASEELVLFLHQYAHAHEAKADTLVDQIGEIHQKAWVPVMIKDAPLIVDGKVIMTVDRASAAAVKLEADNKKWMAEKLAPKKYGAKQSLDLTSGGKRIKNDWHIHPVTADKHGES